MRNVCLLTGLVQGKVEMEEAMAVATMPEMMTSVIPSDKTPNVWPRIAFGVREQRNAELSLPNVQGTTNSPIAQTYVRRFATKQNAWKRCWMTTVETRLVFGVRTRSFVGRRTVNVLAKEEATHAVVSIRPIRVPASTPRVRVMLHVPGTTCPRNVRQRVD